MQQILVIGVQRWDKVRWSIISKEVYFWWRKPNPSKSNVIQYITIAETGNAQDFGDLSYAADAQIDQFASSPIRGIAAGGNTGSKINKYII